MLRLSELNKIDGIEFLPYDELGMDQGTIAVETIRAGRELSVVDMLAQKFKVELTQIGQMFMRDEDNEIFIPLRKYYATALRYALENHDPMTDKKFVTLKNDVGLGMEIHYYETVIVPQIADGVYKDFFIDMKHPLLYNFLDGQDDYSMTAMSTGHYGFMKWENRIAEAINPNKSSFGMSRGSMDKIFEDSGLAELFKETWCNTYTNRLSTIFSAMAQAQIRKSDASMKRMGNLTDDLMDIL